MLNTYVLTSFNDVYITSKITHLYNVLKRRNKNFHSGSSEDVFWMHREHVFLTYFGPLFAHWECSFLSTPTIASIILVLRSKDEK